VGVCESKNSLALETYVFKKKMGLRVQNMLIILSSVVNMIEGTYMITRIFTFVMNKIFIWASQLRGKWQPALFEFVDYLALNVCFISYEKWVQKEKYPSKACLPYDNQD
jgi:hypothetical protein